MEIIYTVGISNYIITAKKKMEEVDLEMEQVLSAWYVDQMSLQSNLKAMDLGYDYKIVLQLDTHTVM